ncbi:TetR/AcrR family transcriptional regulator [Leucobacter edaphi]|uniref:TetR/AcrR family transcriptional regulator n=1 Tax=Leucobacter edaphi TaxID=2796472 RepID=UPI0034E2258D
MSDSPIQGAAHDPGTLSPAATGAAPPPSPHHGAAPATGPVLTPRRQQTRARLLDAATLVFAEEGFLGASVESITQRAGFTRGAFYSNFSSKEELFLALLDREYATRAASIRERAATMAEIIRSEGRTISPADASRFVSEFFAPTGDEALWYALEAEFTLLAMREPESAPEFIDFVGRFSGELGSLVEEIALAAGRHFVIPVERAMPVLSGIYDRAFRMTALRGADAPEGLNELGDRVAELVFALTAPNAAGAECPFPLPGSPEGSAPN